MATSQGVPPPPEYLANEQEHRRQIARSLISVISSLGQITVTLTANAASTTITDQRIGAFTVLWPMPTTANAAAALGGLYFDSFMSGAGGAAGSCVAHHANNAQTDRTFTCLIFSLR